MINNSSKNSYKLNLSKYSTHNIILKNIGSKKKVLDVGCNDGYIGKLSDKTNAFFGLDSSKACIDKAKKIYEDAVVYDLNDLKKLPWKVRFDLIIFADVLEHTLNPDKVLSFFINNYFKDDGEIIISVPNIANWQIRLGLLLGKFNYTEAGILDKTHLHFYTFNSAKELVEANNFQIIGVQSGSSLFGYILNLFPFLRGLFATSIIVIAKKKLK
jgi:2-polyprenyl-3-methyl-5-hydroxy-6-metoxy-1,4-benzoquinol methylase